MISEEHVQAQVVVPDVASETLLDLLRQRSVERPSELIYRFLSDDGREIESLTYAALDRQARAIAHLLQESGAYGQPVLLVLPPGLQFVSAFFGCLYAGAIATPAYPPASEKNALRLSSIAADARPFVGLTTSSIMNSRRRSVAELITSAGIRWLTLDTLQEKRADAWQPPRIEAGTLALLQYTSGSTAAPKGVMITHANLLHNQSLIQRAFGQTEQSVIVSWLPLYHDMGLIGAVLQPLYVGAECVLLSPMAFLQRPVRWLEVISKYRATTSGGPNFAFDLCARKVTPEQKRELDLSSWSVAFSGAEPILAGTLDRFASEFEECGFRRSAFRPCYGLAEATLLVSAAEAGGPYIIEADARALELNRIEQPASPATTRRLVSSGPPVSGQALAIVNPETLERCEPNQVGEIWVSGPSVSGGYWKRPHETRERLMASLPGDTNTYLRTGDLGFLDGHGLFVTGRLKELIIVHGLNYHPLDIEITVQRTNPALRAGCGAAFSIKEGGQQRIVLVQEIERGATTIAETLFAPIRDAVTREHELSLDIIALVLPASLPKTSSGKIRRAECREQFLAGELRIVAQYGNLRPGAGESRTVEQREHADGGHISALENLLIRIWEDVLEIRTIDSGSNFFEAGGDSVSAAQVIARASRELGKEIPFHLLFDNPTVAQFAAALACMDDAPDEKPPLRRLGLKESALSHAQQRLWIDEQLRAGQSVYNIPMALRINGDLVVSALQSGLDEIVRRHESLRTRFISDDGEPRQLIVPHLRLDVPLVDLSGAEQEDAEARLGELLRAEAARPFNLEEAPLVRAKLVRLGAHRHVLVLIVHHLVCDGWSAAVMLRELSKLYAALAQGRPSPLEELPIQYADFAVRQREILQGEVLEALLGYWRKQLAGVPYHLQLPADHPRPVVNLHRGARCPLHLDAELSRRLATLGRQEDATLFMTLAALFQILLARYSGQQEFLLGCPVANRSEVETQGLIGFLVNTVVLRCDLREDPCFRPLLRCVRETVLEAHAHQDLPFEKLVEELQPEREPGSTPLFQVMLLLRQAEPVIEVEGLRLEPLKVETDAAMYDLTLELTESPKGLRGGFEYNVDLFDAATMERFADHFLNLARAVVEEESAATPASRLPVLSDAERRRLLLEWNDTRRDYGQAACLHELVWEQALRSPDAIAVSSAEGQLSYRELQIRASHLGSWLQEQGIGPESRVGVCMTRSPEMVLGLLGVLEAGAAYVPLDPGYPRERLVYMTQDAGLHIILTQQALAAEIPGTARLLCLDSQWEQVTACKPRPRHKAIPDNVAYLIYTSGSTGKPKGVMNSHRGIVNRLRWMRAHYKVGTADRFVQKTPFSFDVSVWEFFAPLISGSCLVMAKPEGHRDPVYLVELIEDEQITVVHFVPAMLQPFLEHVEPQSCRSVRQFICSGEALPTELQERFFKIMSAHLDNLYGPTEAAVEVTAWRCRADYARVPIGRPISNLRAYVLDRWREPVPVGVSGELYIGGAGVARGYWRKPHLTAERFLPDPFSSTPGTRLYRTGDLVRWLPDGTLEFLGRLDDQVKIRGHRVEPSEITSLLCEHPGVGQAVVRACGHDASRHLVAYVVARAACEPLKSGELRSYLKGRVPDYMMPSAFVLLEELPLTPSGKVNTSALPEVVREAIEEGQRGGGKDVGGGREIEEMVAGVWAEVLGIEEVGGGENFFELGGHSLLATQVVARVRRQMGVRVGLRELFEAPTLNHFALRVEAALRQRNLPDSLPAVRCCNRDEELPLSFAQSRLWFLEQLEPGNSAYATPAAARLKGSLNYEALQRALSEIVRRHESLRTRFIGKGGRPVQLIYEAAPVCLDSVDLTGLPDDERESAVNRLLRQEGARGFDLERGPLFRTQLLRLAEDHHVLIVSMHHIVSDGWSVGILIRELQHLYQAFVQGTPSALPDLPLQYVDYAVWQREYLEGENLRRQLDYWKERLTGLKPLNLLADRQRDTSASDEAEIESLELSEELSARLRALGRREGVTLFMTLLAAFKLLLARHSGQKDVAVGTPIAGRSLAEWENLIGFFVNTLVMRTSLSGNPTFRQLLSRVRETTLGAYAHQDTPFEKLVEELQPDRNLSRHPFFDIFFNHVNVPSTDAELTGLKIDLLDVAGGDSKFPLTVYTRDDNRQITLRVAYRQSLFYPERIRLLLDQYQEILSRIVERPDDPIASYSLITSRMLPLLPDPKAEMTEPHFDLVTEMFNRRVVESPHNVAVTQGGREWSYEELSESAHGIARALLNLGLKPGQTVAVCGEKSFGLIAGILAASLSGGVLFTLDRKLPTARQHSMFEIAGVKYVLYAGSLRQQDAWMFERSGVDTLTLDDQSGSVVAHNGQTIRRENPESFERIMLPEQSTADAAYIFFTSGTTGVPKGVLGCHQGLSHFITWQREEFGIGPGDRSAQLTGLSFDVVLRDIFLPLTSGATLCLPDDEDEVVSGHVLTWLDRERVSVLHTVPSLAESWLMSPPYESSVTSLRIVFFAGEPLTSRLVEGWREVTSSRCQIVNLYGPTETTLAKCFYRVPFDCLPGPQPVGKPIPQTQALILRDRDQLCGVGEIGEVVIRTPFRSLGYVNASEEGRRRFVRNPYRDEEQDLLYHTGDMGRYRSDGMIELLGRIDDQLKIRGHRIEPGEIECLLRAHPAVGSAAVVARPCAGGEKRLVAYVALINNSSLSPTELRGYLRRQLPEYMIPATFVLLPALPLTPNGKVDRESLPDPEQPAGDGYEQPRDEIEELLAGIWSEVLGLELVGRDQNFFDLGGHSLVATQVISRVREIFRVDLPVRTLFSTPTISGIAEAIRAAQRYHQTPSQPQLRHIERGPLLPLSFAQQRLWFIDQLEPGGHAYVIPAAVRLSGELNDAALRRALFAIAQRHENLRTRFVNTDGTPMQVIDAEPGFEFRLADLSRESSGEELEARASDLLHDETRRAFDLSREHLFRALLIRLSAKEHILLMTVHHIVSDAWSMGVLSREFKAFYQACCDGTPPALPDLPVQYADYAAWQRDYLQGETLERQLSYWRKQLKGAEPLELPADHARPPVQTYKGAAEPFTIPAVLVEDIRRLGRREGCTLFMTLLAAFQILLSKYSGQKDVLVGTPIAGRVHPDLEGLIGFFVNTLVMRTSMTVDSTLREILQRVREAALGAFTHQDVPFEKLIEDLQPSRDPSRSPLFQVMFIFQHSSRKAEEFRSLNVRPLEVEVTAAKFDLTLTVLGDSEELNCVIEYNTDLFERDRILRLIRHFNVVLEAMAADADQSFSTLSLLDHDERRKILRDWNATEVNYTGERNVARLFEIQAARTPDRVAFIEGERRLSYGELNRRANRLARRLKQSSLREESTAAVCMRRSLDMMVALLAILKAGGAYVPIDPELPGERIAMMLSDSKARLVITERSLSERVSKGDAEVIRLDADWDEIETYDSSNLSCGLGGDAALYLIYTSGSTGRPKGVLGTHGGTLNRFRWMWEAFPFEDGEVCSLKTSLSFVDSVWECFGPLLAGVPAVMIPETMVGNAEALVSRLAQENVTRIVLVPSLLESLVENYSNLGELLPALRFWVCSGETLAGQLAERFHAAMPTGRLINLYGCSEVAGDVTHHVAARTPSTKPVPIGRPVANTQMYILDEYMNPCGVGLPGQVYVGGAHLARGYWNRPGETADRFVPNPFATHVGQRLYRTGDLGRYARSGEIEYLGRLDYQLKVRGYRIESGEIESILGQHPNVRMIQVVAADVGPSNKKLVAYVVLSETGESAIRDLYDYAARFLPSYMIPSAFVPLEKFSLLPNGKINRRALPAAGRSHTLSVGTAAAASTPVEASLVEIWREVLGLDQVGIYDNFFDLGGHSLALVKVRARIESRFGRRVSLPELFTYPTIAALSRRLLDAGTQPDTLAEVRHRSARQKESSRRRRQQRIEQRVKRQEITS